MESTAGLNSEDTATLTLRRTWNHKAVNIKKDVQVQHENTGSIKGLSLGVIVCDLLKQRTIKIRFFSE